MRARNIKPGICNNEVLGSADPIYTLLFERLWMLADRAGRLEDRPLRIKALAFPYRERLDIDAAIDWLSEYGFIQRYSAVGEAYIQVTKFLDHQRPHKNEQPSKIPPPIKGIPRPSHKSTTKVVSTHDQGNGMDALIPSSLIPDTGYLERREEANQGEEVGSKSKGDFQKGENREIKNLDIDTGYQQARQEATSRRAEEYAARNGLKRGAS